MGINVYLEEDVVASIQARNGGEEPDGWMVTRELNRLYALYADAIREVKLSTSEAYLICDMLNGAMIDECSAKMLWAEADDAIALENLDEKWEVDAPALVAKLRGLSTIQCMALVDASERFWSDKNEEQCSRVKVNSYFGIK